MDRLRISSFYLAQTRGREIRLSAEMNLIDWDDNNDAQINFIDYASNTGNFELAFHTNGRYVLTDFKNSVIGATDANNNSVIVISYNAWGVPSYTGDLEGLSILWNGYYYDTETANYYLRNRYYSPLERKFITEDPRGINPDGNWNNRFNILNQYYDGYGLQVYATGDPMDYADPWGTKKCKWVLASSSKKMYTICILMTWLMTNQFLTILEMPNIEPNESFSSLSTRS